MAGQTADVAASRDAAGTESGPISLDAAGTTGTDSSPAGMGTGATADDATGTWYLNAAGSRLALTIRRDGVVYSGSLRADAAAVEPVDSITFDATKGLLVFRRPMGGQWYRAFVNQGTLAGRFSSTAAATAPDVTSYKGHVTGWNESRFPNSATGAMAWEITLGNAAARLRLQKSPATGALVGRMKVYGAAEDLEDDLTVSTWDGTKLKFSRGAGATNQDFAGEVSGRDIVGTFTTNGGAPVPWKGTRAEVLGYGVAGRARTEALSWHAAFRRQVENLMMAGNPAPLSGTATVVRNDVAPFAGAIGPNRDDDAGNWPQNYALTELKLTHTLTVRTDGSTATREVHGYLARPKVVPASGKFPLLVAVNGHGGSAHQTFEPGGGTYGIYWYGDAFARRGYMVLAIDISHRLATDQKLYSDTKTGDDPVNGNGLHPAIKAAGFDTDWEEDGERIWDVQRAVDYLATRTDADMNHLLITGMSMGGEISTIGGALDPRISMVLPAGFSPDMGVVLTHGNHPCWRWQYADIREYLDVSDWEALVSPRPFLVEVGKVDPTYSSRNPPFSADKQVARRARVAYADLASLSSHRLYLHYDGHGYHVGGAGPQRGNLGVQIATTLNPAMPDDRLWQTDAATASTWPTTFDAIKMLLP